LYTPTWRSYLTTKQEALMSVLSHKEQISGPPKYLTTDWKAAEKSVGTLRDLKPQLAIPSHGEPMEGEELTRHLEMLVNNFKEIAVPDQGVFVKKIMLKYVNKGLLCKSLIQLI
jgi:hypothetical protein